MKRLTRYLLMLLFLLAAVEGFSYLVLALDINLLRSRMYWTPSATEEEFEQYLQQRDPLLGWPTKNFLANRTDHDGARLSPANEALAEQPVCVSIYGNSFAYSLEVDDAKAWPNVLAKELNCQVKNYGVSGYGVDQALIRFENNHDDDAVLTILAFYIDDITRNMMQWFYLTWGDIFTFKPAFSIGEDGRLRLQEIPVNSYETLIQTFETPEEVLKTESYLPNQHRFSARVYASFPYSWSLTLLVRRVVYEIDWDKAFSMAPIKDWNHPSWYDSPKGPSPEKIDLNTRIIERFIQRCRAKGRACVVLIIPDYLEIGAYQEQGTMISDPVIDPMRDHAEVWDATKYFAATTQRKGVCYYFGSDRELCEGHFTAEGYALLAHFVAEKIRAEGLIAGPAS